MFFCPLKVALFVNADNDRYNLKFDFFTIFEDVWVEDMEIKVRVCGMGEPVEVCMGEPHFFWSN